jgi:hypothetical protein
MPQATSDPVVTFARMMRLIGKWLLFGLLILIGLCAALAGAIYFIQWYTYDRHVAQVGIKVSTDRRGCSDDSFPIGISVDNSSSKVLERFEFTLAAREQGRSTDLVQYHSWLDDHILQPGYHLSQCWSVPPLTQRVADPRALVWTIKYSSFVFK